MPQTSSYDGENQHENDKLALYEGDTVRYVNEILRTTSDFGSQVSLDRVMTAFFYSSYIDVAAGIDLTVSVIDASTVQEMSVTDGGEILMPKRGSASATIPDGVNSFHVYDDGGSEDNYGYLANGYLVLTAPEGKVFQLRGDLNANSTALLSIFDGDSTATKLFDKPNYIYGAQTVGPVYSTGNVLSFYFTSEYYRETRAGFDFVVSVEDASTLHTVSIAPVENGRIGSNT